MKARSADALLGKLAALKSLLKNLLDLDSQSAAAKEIGTMVETLLEVRARLTSADFQEKASQLIPALDQVLLFLEGAKSDKSLQSIVSQALCRRPRKPRTASTKVTPSIQPSMTNQQIRDIIQQDLSRADLEQIAKQRSIATNGRSKTALRSAIMDFISRQESYEILRH
jgi:carboxylesterase type B